MPEEKKDQKQPDQKKKNLLPHEKYPTSERSRTDIVFAIILYIFIVVFIGVGVAGFIMGNPKRIMRPYDESGNQCGEKGTPVEEYKYLYFQNMSKSEWNKNNACVKKCPSSKEEKIECYPHLNIINCTEDLVARESELFADRFCYHTEVIEKTRNETMEKIGISNKYTDQTKQQAYYDIIHSWRVLLVAVILTAIFCFVFLLLLRTCAKLVILICLVLMVVLMALLGWYLFYTWRKFSNNHAINADQGKFYLIAAIVVWSIAALFICAACCFWPNVESSSKVIKISTQYLMSNMRVFMVPIIFTVALILFFIYFAISGMYLFTVGITKHQKEYPFGEISWLPYWE